MAVEVYVNQAVATVTSGGNDAPLSGTQETWGVASSSALPAASSSANPPTQFHIADTTTGYTGEIVTVTNVSGTALTVIRGAESTSPVIHILPFSVQQVVSAGAMKQARSTDWLNVVTMFGVDNTGATDVTTALNNILSSVNSAGGGVVYFPAGTYKISSALTYATHNLTMIGDGAGDNFSGNLTIIHQTSTTANGITLTDADNINIQGIAFTGPGSGSGKGIALNYSSPPTQFSSLTDVFVGSFGGDGVYTQQPILTTFTRVWSANNGGWGFNIDGGGTSCGFTSCWARNNSGNGWRVTGAYHNFSACASDINTGVGWRFDGAQSCSISGCGSELNTGNAVELINSCFALSFNGLWVSNKAIGLSIDASCFRIHVAGFLETNGGGATHSIQVGAGGIATIIQPQITTSVNYLAGGAFVNQIQDNGILLGGVLDCTGLEVQEFANGKQGTANLTGGSVVVSNTSTTANSRIFLTAQSPGGTPGALYVHGRTAGTSFTVYSTSATDTSTFAYEMFEPG